MISVYSQVFDRYIDVDEVEQLPINEVYIFLDELQSHKELLEKKWRRVPKAEREKEEELLYDLKAINTLFIIAKRRAHYINHSRVNQLTKAVIIWKKRAFTLGKQLNMTRDQVSEIKVHHKGAVV